MALAVMSAEDTVRYRIFCSLDADNKSPDVLSQRLVAIEAKLKPKINAYMWHVEKFNLKVVDSISVEIKDALEPHIYGSVFYGENVDDEWYIAHLFLELTRDDNDLVVQIDDEDGDIFLMEAANCLPKWITPENGANRVYLHRGAVHIVPETVINEDDLTPKNAVALVRSSPAKTVAASSIQQAIRGKTKDFETPEAIRTTKLHQATVSLPVKAAQILRDEPTLVSDAIRAFHFRTPLDDKALLAMKHFPPEICVKRSLLISRFNYAFLRHDRYAPNPVTGWKIPFSRARDKPEFIEADLGMKIASGLEILCVALEEQKASLKNNARFLHYIRRLKERNYFEGSLDGSEKYHELYEKAKGYFLEQDNDGEDPESSHQPRKDILDTVKSTYPDMALLTEEETSLPPADNERWLELNEAELNGLLEQYTQGAPSQGLQDAFNEESLSKHINQSLQDFMDHTSSHEGVVPPSKSAKKNNRRRKQKKERSKESRNQKQVVLAPTKPVVRHPPQSNALGVDDLSGMLKAVLDFSIPSESDDDSSSMSSYGEEEGRDEHLAKEMQEYLKLMDKELDSTTIGQSFEKVKQAPRAALDDWDDDVPEVDIPLTALKNILKSTASAGSNPGPAQNLLHSMGVHIPPTLDSDDDDEN